MIDAVQLALWSVLGAVSLGHDSRTVVEARVAGKVGYSDNYYSGKSYSGINDELILVSIIMAVIIAVLIGIALCYIVREKCNKRREYYVSA